MKAGAMSEPRRVVNGDRGHVEHIDVQPMLDPQDAGGTTCDRQ